MVASINTDRREYDKYFQYQIYVTDALQVIAQNTGYTSAAITKNGKAPTKRFGDVVSKQKEKPKQKPKQSGKEIAAGIIGGLKE